jgi:hypothetical protein
MKELLEAGVHPVRRHARNLDACFLTVRSSRVKDAAMPRAKSNGIELEYDTFGKESDPPLLLIMGFSAQMTAWDEAFCRQIAGDSVQEVNPGRQEIHMLEQVMLHEPAKASRVDRADASELVEVECPRAADVECSGSVHPPQFRVGRNVTLS